ncbi:MAG: sulfurtransferase FdhD, partial [Deltaproteobacteria bacterium]
RFERIADDIVDVHLRSPLARTRLPERSTFATSSCGVCGKVSIESLRVRAAPIESAVRVPADVVAALPDALRAQQSVFDCTGGLHAAGLFSPEGNLWVGREDVGRHNAVDKVVGWALAAGRLPATDALLCVSGRLSFEIVQKAIAARVPLVAAVSAPSTAAVDLAREFGVTLCGFVRAGRFNCYTHAHRVC